MPTFPLVALFGSWLFFRWGMDKSGSCHPMQQQWEVAAQLYGGSYNNTFRKVGERKRMRELGSLGTQITIRNV